MNTEDYVSYQLALALKKAGFDEPCDHFYYDNGFENDTDMYCLFYKNYNSVRDRCCSAPTLWQAQKWLREKGIHISVNPYMGYDVDADGTLYNEYPSWGFELMDVASAEFMNDAGGNHTSYESALSAGIAAALELIEKK